MDIQSQSGFYYSDIQEKCEFSEESQKVESSEKLRCENYQILPSSSKDFCNECTYWKNHGNSTPAQHKSCICELFANQSICCLEGYANLMNQIPYMIIYAPTPNKYNSNSCEPFINPIQIESNQVIEIIDFSNNLKQKNIPKLNFPYKNQYFRII